MRRAQNIFIRKNIDCVTIVITLEGIQKLQTEKKNKKRQQSSLRNISLKNAVRKHQQTLK